MHAPVTYPEFKWTRNGTDDYFYAIDQINDKYRKMLAISEAKKVFRDKTCPLMTVRSKKEFRCEQKNFKGNIWSTPNRTGQNLFCQSLSSMWSSFPTLERIEKSCLHFNKTLQKKGSSSLNMIWNVSICSCVCVVTWPPGSNGLAHSLSYRGLGSAPFEP